MIDHQCPKCGLKVKRLDGDGLPKPGGFLLCGTCGHLMVFDEDLALRKPTKDEARIADEDLEIRFARQIIRGRAIGRAQRRN